MPKTQCLKCNKEFYYSDTDLIRWQIFCETCGEYNRTCGCEIIRLSKNKIWIVGQPVDASLINKYVCELCKQEFDKVPEYPNHGAWLPGKRIHISCIERLNGQPYPTISIKGQEQEYKYSSRKDIKCSLLCDSNTVPCKCECKCKNHNRHVISITSIK